jgi:hypothetical protein
MYVKLDALAGFNSRPSVLEPDAMTIAPLTRKVQKILGSYECCYYVLYTHI